MKLFVVKTSEGFYPAHASDKENFDRLKSGEVYEVTIAKPRNYMFHRKFFALLKVGFEAQRTFEAFDWYREWVIMKAGHFETVKSPKGADLYGANLYGANLKETKLSDNEYLVRSIFINGSRHSVSWWGLNMISIGCHRKEIEWWKLNYKMIGEKEGYTPKQMDEYYQYILICEQMQNSLKGGQP